jgi:hypothetical protein
MNRELTYQHHRSRQQRPDQRNHIVVDLIRPLSSANIAPAQPFVCFLPQDPTSARLGDFHSRPSQQEPGASAHSRPPSRGCAYPRPLPTGLLLSHPRFASQRHQPAYAAVRPIAQLRYHPGECQRITPIDWVHIQPNPQVQSDLTLSVRLTSLRPGP